MSTLTILQELQALAQREAEGDKLAHVELLSGVQRLQNAVTTPAEKMIRMRFTMYQNTCVRLAQEYNILQALSKNDRMSAAELSQETGTDEMFIVRIMRFVTMIGVADEVGPSQYAANETTNFAIQKGILGDVKYYTDIVMKICSNMGPLAAAAKAGGPGSEAAIAFADPHKATYGKSMFPYMAEHREYGQAFEDFMTARRPAAAWGRWFEVFPAAERIQAREQTEGTDKNEENALLVDIAGGQGFWTQQFRKAFPAAKGRIQVQDQPHVIEATRDQLAAQGIEVAAYDFFTPQPIRGSYFYYFKQILHNWGDEDGTRILKNTADAMLPGGRSTLLIDDYVLPAEKVGLRATGMDIAMLVLLSPALERTEEQWQKLTKAAGLEIVKIWYTEKHHEGSEAIIECIKP